MKSEMCSFIASFDCIVEQISTASKKKKKKIIIVNCSKMLDINFAKYLLRTSHTHTYAKWLTTLIKYGEWHLHHARQPASCSRKRFGCKCTHPNLYSKHPSLLTFLNHPSPYDTPFRAPQDIIYC